MSMFTHLGPVIVLFNIIDLFHYFLRLYFRMFVNILNSKRSPTSLCINYSIVLFTCVCVCVVLINYLSFRLVPYCENYLITL